MAHLTISDRKVIYLLLQEGYTRMQIAASLNVSPSTVGNEINRNKDKTTGTYSFELAERKARERKRNKKKRVTLTDEMKALICSLLDLHYSPEQIHGFCKNKNIPIVSVTTIYKHIKKTKQTTKLRLYKKGRRGKMYKYTDKVNISERPKIVEERIRFGDLECDTIHGKNSKGGILTINDRKTGFVWASKLENLTSSEVTAKFLELLEPVKDRIITITSDNGSEFADYEKISKTIDACFFFADPHSPWQRGSNENTNGLFRQYFKKGLDLRKVTDEDVKKVVDILNTRPRKRLKFLTPLELFQQEVLAV